MEGGGRGVPRMGRLGMGMGMGLEDWQLGDPIEVKTPAREVIRCSSWWTGPLESLAG